MDTAILLGAGSSVAASYPSTQLLTDMVLSGCGIQKDGDGSYNLYDKTMRPEKAQAVNCMVRKLYTEAKSYYEPYPDRCANYEDLYYLAKQALDDESGEMENPAILPFVKKLKTSILPLLEELLKDETNYTNILIDTCDYITYVIHQNLLISPLKQEHLRVLADICRTINITSISTLCHDTHVEKFLIDADIKISNGFSEPQENVQYWNGDFSASNQIPFLKLHGSVNWLLLKPDPESFYNEKILIPPKDQYPNRVKLQGERWRYPFPVPLLLIGTFNKIAEYSSGIFRELHYQFRSTINKADQLVVCGYSFGDKGINTEIIEWLYGRRKRRLVIIHPHPESLFTYARGAIQKHWDEWENNGALFTIKKPFEDMGIEDFTGASRGN